jgi:uncharacterized protein YjcR
VLEAKQKFERLKAEAERTQSELDASNQHIKAEIDRASTAMKSLITDKNTATEALQSITEIVKFASEKKTNLEKSVAEFTDIQSQLSTLKGKSEQRSVELDSLNRPGFSGGRLV